MNEYSDNVVKVGIENVKQKIQYINKVSEWKLEHGMFHQLSDLYWNPDHNLSSSERSSSK